MVKIENFEDVIEIYQEFCGVQPLFTLTNIYKIWKVLCNIDKEIAISTKKIAEKASLNENATRGIISFFTNMNILEESNKKGQKSYSKITYLGKYWIKVIDENKIKFSQLLSRKVMKFKTVKLILSCVRENMPQGIKSQDIEENLSQIMIQYWKILPDYPKDPRSKEPAKKPFNRVVSPMILDLLEELLILVKVNQKYYGPLFED